MLNELQNYMVYEFVADYRDGHLSRRDLVRRVLNITGGVGTTATLLMSLGAFASPVAAAGVTFGAQPVPGAQSPLSVAADDPAVEGQDISFPGADGANVMAYQARPAGASGPLPLVLVCHENRGLTEHIRDVVRRFAKEGYMACGVDLVSRQGGTAKITDPNQFSALLTGPGVNMDQFVSDFASAVAYYKTKPDLVDANKIAMNGFCFGGGIVWRSTQQIPQLKAAAPFYGAPPPLDQVSMIKA